MRISGWSSDVCSSDLVEIVLEADAGMAAEGGRRGDAGGLLGSESADRPGQRRRLGPGLDGSQIGQQVVRQRALARRVAAQHEEQEGGTRRYDALGLQPPEAL